MYKSIKFCLFWGETILFPRKYPEICYVVLVYLFVNLPFFFSQDLHLRIVRHANSFFSWSINSLNHLQQQHPSAAQQQSPQQPRTGTGWKPTLLGAGSFERCHGWKSQMHQALLLRRNRVPLEGFTFSWSCSWGTACWHMLSYMQLCSGILSSVIYFRSCTGALMRSKKIAKTPRIC